jgi:VWFA-related protein
VRISPLLAAVLLIQAASGSFSQQPQPSPTPAPQSQQTTPQKAEDVDVVRITTNLVQVDAVVTDKNGKVVTDLKPNEVEIYEDGHKQKITNFSYNVAESTPTGRDEKQVATKPDKNAPFIPPTILKPEDVRRTIALVVDDLGLSFESAYYVRQALKKFVDQQMQSGDLVAIIRTSGGMGALQQFTSDKRQLYAAIERVKYNAAGRAGVSAFAPLESSTINNANAADAGNTAQADLDQFREDVFAVGTLGALSYVIRGLRELPGRKSILLLSDGIKIFNRDDPGRSDRVLEALQRLTDQANRASVVIYTMDARGLQTLSLTAADDASGMSAQQVEDQLSNRRADFFESQNGLNYLAQQTGGLAIRNTNDLSGGIKRVLEDQRGYYLIGYRPDQSTFDPRTGRRKFHKLKLEVTRPGKFTVRMRNGFFGVTDEERNPRPATLAQQLVRALSSPFGSTGVHLQLTSLFANDVKVGSFMRSVLHIDAHDLTFTDEPNNRHKCVFDVLSMTFGDNGVPVDQSGKTFTIQLNDDWYKRVQRDGVIYFVTVPIKKPGAYQLRMSLRDTSSERIGSASQFVEVPDLKKNRLALSGLSIAGSFPNQSTSQSKPAATDPANTNSAAAQVAQSEDVADQGNAEASPVVRHFARGMAMDYGFMIYNARLDKTTNRPQLTTQVRLFRNGKEVFTGRANPYDAKTLTDPKRLIAAGRVLLGTDMVPGDYVVQIIVTDALADEKHRTATQWMDFEIVK